MEDFAKESEVKDTCLNTLTEFIKHNETIRNY